MKNEYKATIISNLAYWLTAFIIKTICLLNGGLSVKGRENVPENGGAIIASNHISYLDPPVIGSVSPRRVTFMARKGLFSVPVLGWMIKHAAFPVDREKTTPSLIKETVKRLRRGEIIAIFPEGRRSETGELLEAKRGIGIIAGLSKVPVVPTLVVGTNKALPLGSKWLKRHRITVIFGEPVCFTSHTEWSELQGHALHEEISRKIMRGIKDLKIKYDKNL